MRSWTRLTRQGAAGLLAVMAFVVIVVAMAVETTPKADAEAAPGVDPDLAVFTVQASHGYEVTIFSSRFSEGLQDDGSTRYPPNGQTAS